MMIRIISSSTIKQSRHGCRQLVSIQPVLSSMVSSLSSSQQQQQQRQNANISSSSSSVVVNSSVHSNTDMNNRNSIGSFSKRQWYSSVSNNRQLLVGNNNVQTNNNIIRTKSIFVHSTILTQVHNKKVTTVYQRNFFWGSKSTKPSEETPVSAASTTETTTTDTDQSTDINNSTNTNNDASAVVNSNDATTIDVDEAINKLFEDSQQEMIDKVTAADNAAAGTSDAWFASNSDTLSTVATGADWTPDLWNVADQSVVVITSIHAAIGGEIAIPIIISTILLRLFIFPLMVIGQRNGSRMAHVQPELTVMKNRYEALGTPSRQEQVQFMNNMKLLFKRYEVKPALQMVPMLQVPLFMGMFFGLRKLPDIYPTEMATGGILWFTDLTACDPYFILPAIAASTMLATIEINKDQTLAQDPVRGETMLNVMRIMSVVSIPFLISFDSGMVLYWVTNNTLTFTQTYILHQKPVRKFFNIWDPPKPIPGGQTQAQSLMDSLKGLKKRIQGEPITEKDQIKHHNAAVEAKRNAIRLVRESRAQRLRQQQQSQQ